ncbi:ATP-grasp domain-containing protein [Paenibacillus sp. FSL L8-0689]|uniref:ATP-grasp domain-containing protein n=1 Tax=Paenibacillus sp. FSL L8-0689 TaxID=2921607 RepID=UPI0030FA0AEA
MDKHYVIFAKFENFSRIVNEGLSSLRYEKTLITNNQRLIERCSDHYHHFLCVEDLTSPQVVEFILTLHDEKPVNGIFSESEDLVQFTALLRERLGLTCGVIGRDGDFFRDKVKMKNHLAQEKVILIPEYRTVHHFADAIDFLSKHAPEAIIKPIDGAGSLHTFRVHLDNIHEYEQLLNDHAGKFEIEQYIDGKMFHMDSVVYNNQAAFTSVACYTHSTLECREGKPLCGYFYPDHEMPLVQQLIAANNKVLSAMPITSGVAHTELLVTKQQEILFCETAARIAGGGIIFGIEDTCGVNPLLEGARAFVGEQPLFNQYYPQTNGGYLLLYKKKGRVKHVTPSSDFLQIQGVKRADILPQVGDCLSFSGSSGDVAGVVTWSVDSFEENERIRNEIEHLWELEMEVSLFDEEGEA